MPILIRDETANAYVLQIDNAGNFYFGDGTPISKVTIAGQEIIDNNGFIVHGLYPCSVNGISGSVNCPDTTTVSVTTLLIRQPTVQVDSDYPAIYYQYQLNDPTDPSLGGREQLVSLNGLQVHDVKPFVGYFQIHNNNFYDGQIADPSSDAYDPSVGGFYGVLYRWI